MSEHIPDFFLEQYRLGEASEDVAAYIKADEEAQARLAAMDSEDVEMFQAYPPKWFADRVRERAGCDGNRARQQRCRGG